MNKWSFISISIALAVGIIITGVLYARENGNVSALETELADSKEDVLVAGVELHRQGLELSTLEGDLAVAEAQVSSLGAQVSTLETQVSTLEAEVSALETALAE